MVLDRGRDDEVADELRILPQMLALWVENRLRSEQFLAEIESGDGP